MEAIKNRFYKTLFLISMTIFISIVDFSKAEDTANIDTAKFPTPYQSEFYIYTCKNAILYLEDEINFDQDINICFGFIIGSLQTKSLYKEDYCIPGSATPIKIMRSRVLYLENNPSEHHLPAAETFRNSMKNDYPCF